MSALMFHDLNDPRLLRMLEQGAVGVIPTDTVYGLVCSAYSKNGVQKLYGLKSRDNKPGTIIGADTSQVAALGIPEKDLAVAEGFWPNPLSIVLPADDNLSHLHLGKKSLAVRVPNNPALQELLKSAGLLLTTSANHPGEPTATNIEIAKGYFGDGVDFYVDAGELGESLPSTIIKITDGQVEVIRQGAVKFDEEDMTIK